MTIDGDLRAAAEFLAKDHLETEPNLLKIYWFPAEKEIRLIDIDPLALPVYPGDSIAAFHFPPDAKGGVPFQTAIALVHPDDEKKPDLLPPGWGDWSDATLLWEAK